MLAQDYCVASTSLFHNWPLNPSLDCHALSDQGLSCLIQDVYQPNNI